MNTANWPLFTRRSSLLALAGVAIFGLFFAGCAASTNGTTDAADSYEQRLANHLNEADATMYGAFWCPHCSDQKELFGEAVDSVPYVECDPEGDNAQPQLCMEKEIKGYPTWEIDGEFYPGTRSLEELAKLSGFEADSQAE